MSILIGKLASLTLVPVVGAGVAYTTMSTKLGGGEKQIELRSMEDFQKHCWVSIQGDAKDEGGFNQKLLACDLSKNSLKIKFFFHDEQEMKDALPKEVTNVLYKSGQDFSLTFGNKEIKEIKAVNAFVWKNVFQEGIKVGCQIKHVNPTFKQLRCGSTREQTLEQFVFKK